MSLDSDLSEVQLSMSRSSSPSNCASSACTSSAVDKDKHIAHFALSPLLAQNDASCTPVLPASTVDAGSHLSHSINTSELGSFKIIPLADVEGSPVIDRTVDTDIAHSPAVSCNDTVGLPQPSSPSSPDNISCDLLGHPMSSCSSTPMSLCPQVEVSAYSASGTSVVAHKQSAPSPPPLEKSPADDAANSHSKHLKMVPTNSSSSQSRLIVPSYIWIKGIKFIPSPDLTLDALNGSPNSPHSICDGKPIDANATETSMVIDAPTSSEVHPLISNEYFDTLNIDLPECLDGIPALQPQLSPASQSCSGETPRVHSAFSLAPWIVDSLTHAEYYSASPLKESPSINRHSISPSKVNRQSVLKLLDLGISLVPDCPPSMQDQLRAYLKEYLPGDTYSVDADSVYDCHHPSPSAEEAPLFNDGGLGTTGCLQQQLIAPELIDTYCNVKNRLMPVVYPISSSGVPTDHFDWMSFSDVFSHVNPSLRRSLFNVIMFSSRACWINPSRANPSCVSVVTTDKGPCLTPMEDTHFLAVFITSGIVKQSHIYNPVTFESPSLLTKCILRQLDLSPFEQETQLMLGFFGAALGFTEFALSVSEGVLSFMSMQRFPNEVKSGNPNDYAPTIPIKMCPRSAFYAENNPRLKLWAHFPYAAPFRSPIPIYDSRTTGLETGFEASPNQLHELGFGSYPLFNGGMVDLPQGSIVSVGYTAHSFPTLHHYRHIASTLLLNLAFVLLLSLPPGIADTYLASSNSALPSHLNPHAASSSVSPRSTQNCPAFFSAPSPLQGNPHCHICCSGALFCTALGIYTLPSSRHSSLPVPHLPNTARIPSVEPAVESASAEDEPEVVEYYEDWH
ncbi:hypothetical protein GYMLUDRAFT_63371 [Collybiopsis luxurians FD-317 M1]|uniref:Uncharacterized protein n=1 Tax=Collybiopsis luxurians FD-317 M1 TaxID=944289 RepID=A0A0D0BH40_9AGAR|nr:hypothetical protein GYMLUDRAFT_63371 [Collybiopsis luxurians FD-317 M1]